MKRKGNKQNQTTSVCGYGARRDLNRCCGDHDNGQNQQHDAAQHSFERGKGKKKEISTRNYRQCAPSPSFLSSTKLWTVLLCFVTFLPLNSFSFTHLPLFSFSNTCFFFFLFLFLFLVGRLQYLPVQFFAFVLGFVNLVSVFFPFTQLQSPFTTRG